MPTASDDDEVERDPRDADWTECAAWCGVALLALTLVLVGWWFVTLMEAGG